MLTVNQEIPEELLQTSSAVLCPLLAGQMSVSEMSRFVRFTVDVVLVFLVSDHP